MTKSEFVDQVAEQADLSKKEAQDAVDAVLDDRGGAQARQRGDVLRLRQVPRRPARRPQGHATRAPARRSSIAASRVPRFSAGRELKKAVND